MCPECHLTCLCIARFHQFSLARSLWKDVWHFRLTKCLYLKYISNLSDISPEQFLSPSKLGFWALSDNCPSIWCYFLYNITKSVPVPFIIIVLSVVTMAACTVWPSFMHVMYFKWSWLRSDQAEGLIIHMSSCPPHCNTPGTLPHSWPWKEVFGAGNCVTVVHSVCKGGHFHHVEIFFLACQKKSTWLNFSLHEDFVE